MARYVAGLGWALGVFTLAMVVRALVQDRMALWEEVPVIPGLFSLRYGRNPGAAFGLFGDAAAGFRIPLLVGVAVLALAAVTVMYVREGHRSRALSFGLATLAGGAAANLTERLLAGDVVDYLDVYVGAYHWPTFNLADVAINVGVGLLLLDAWQERGAARGGARSPAAPPLESRE